MTSSRATAASAVLHSPASEPSHASPRSARPVARAWAPPPLSAPQLMHLMHAYSILSLWQLAWRNRGEVRGPGWARRATVDEHICGSRVAPRRTRRMAGHAHVRVHHDAPKDASQLAASPSGRYAALRSARPVAAARWQRSANRCQRSHRSLQRSMRSLTAIAPIAVGDRFDRCSDRFRRCQRSLRSLSAIHVSLSAIAPIAAQRSAHRCFDRWQRSAIAGGDRNSDRRSLPASETAIGDR